MKRLLIAAGGGGDAIAAVMLHSALYGPAAPALVLTYSWERLVVDPLPGPRGRAHLTGLRTPLPHLDLVTARTAPIPPAGSSLPRLAADLPVELGLLDPYEGTAGLARTIAAAAEYCGAPRVDVVDVGGDILTDGTEPTLRSPLGDALVLAACARTGLPTEVWIAGPGLDREIPERELFGRLPPAAFTLAAAHTEPVRRIFDWHPSEASAMLAAAARGARGRCAIRDVPEPLRLDDRSAGVHRLDLGRALAANPLARRLTDRATLADRGNLADAERASVEICGFSEIARERDRAASFRPLAEVAPGAAELPARFADWQADLRRQDVTLVTRRRVAEEFALGDRDLRTLAAGSAPEAFPLWTVTARHGGVTARHGA
ncbi:DUF1152 domain-containing protein [Kitasatospora sp. NPDC059327]|uniref:DUF1152 domain-containing protein n=1 Tax=Kitasatospora sp. NPDC059327 TaxID=3346803 RepID=UPI0036B49208